MTNVEGPRGMPSNFATGFLDFARNDRQMIRHSDFVIVRRMIVTRPSAITVFPDETRHS